MAKKLGIIAGGGDIPKALINQCKAEKRDFFVVAIEGNADKDLIDDSVPHIWLRIGQAGTGFKKLAEEKVAEVVMIGTIRRPSFKDLVPDLRTAAFFAKLGIKSIGDDGILRALVKDLEDDGGFRFPILDFYLYAAASHPIVGIDVKDFRMLDVGKLDTLEMAEEFISSHFSLAYP